MRISSSLGVMVCVAAIVAIAGCQSQPSTTASSAAPAANAQADANKAAYQRLNDQAFTQGDTAVVDSFLADNVTDHMAMPPGMPTGKEGLKQMIAMFKTGFPDGKFEVEQITADGDMVWAHTTMTGTNTGPFMGMKPTGKPVKVENFDLVRFENGKMVEHWGLMDNSAMMEQMGMGAPAAGKPGKAK